MTNILIVGVGGQGTLLASRVLGAIAAIEGKDCKLSEVHGMSQRGGSVVTHVRIGDNIAAPLVTPGEAESVDATFGICRHPFQSVVISVGFYHKGKLDATGPPPYIL